jgi:FkbM family methyltransferase
MFRDASDTIKRYAPGVHDFLKRVYRRSGIPALKFLNGRLVLVAPQLVGASPSEPHVLGWINGLLKPGDTFFDVGAHQGWMSMDACYRVGAKGKVVAFEPSPPLVECLEYNKKANRLRQMEIVAKAVADSGGRKVPLYVVNRGESYLNSLVDHRTGPIQTGETTTIEAETVSLDEFCEKTKLRPDLAKIDVEGAELLVLWGARRLLEERRTTFIVAVHPCWLPDGQEAADIFDLFRAHRYKAVESAIVPHEGVEFGDYVFAPDRA